MITIYEKIIASSNLNCSKIEINFFDYDFVRGMRFQYRLFNSNDFVIDGGQIDLSGPDFQNWPTAPEGGEEEFDRNYITNKILEKLNLQKDILSTL